MPFEIEEAKALDADGRSCRSRLGRAETCARRRAPQPEPSVHAVSSSRGGIHAW